MEGRGEHAMEIERINENTVKFYISYIDIEDRGFEREEIWYNRERSEQLFWEMMEELSDEEEFAVEGPLWIQVQALEKGLEIIVTKAQISKNGEELEIPIDNENTIDVPVDEKIENMLEKKFGKYEEEPADESDQPEDDENMWIVVSFSDFEDVIQLSHYFQEIEDADLKETLYAYKGKYYLYMEFPEDMFDDNKQEDFISQIFEFADDSELTSHFLEEYGKTVFAGDTFAEIRAYFPAQL
jgi:adapter protein MecA 1/2